MKTRTSLAAACFFTPTEASQAAGRAISSSGSACEQGRDPEVSEKVAPAQIEALGKWGAPRSGRVRLSEGDHPADAGGERRQ